MRRRQYAPKPAQDTSVLSSDKLLQTRPFQPEIDNNLQVPSMQASVQPMSGGWDLTKMEFVDEPPRPQTVGPLIQAKLTIGAPNDKYEQEADLGASKNYGASIDVPNQQSNKTGLPNDLKSGVENLSGISMNDVKVHYNSSKPAELGALAYTQDTDIYVGPGQEKHLGHETWHVVQQKQGRVKPTVHTKGVSINNDQALEKEADLMGEQSIFSKLPVQKKQSIDDPKPQHHGVVQCLIPDTSVKWQYQQKKDSHNNLTFTYPVSMEAIVSQKSTNFKGSPPNNKAEWWPYFQQRHKVMSQMKGQKIYWVQGHLLNDNIHGPGTPDNLVPISNTTNTNQETHGEKVAKHLVLNQGQVIYYRVRAIWNTTPDQKFKDWGAYDPQIGKGLLPGECTAPDALSWDIWTMKETTPDNWVPDQHVQLSDYEWYNTFPEGHSDDKYKMNIKFLTNNF